MQVTHLSVTAFEGVPTFDQAIMPLTLIAGPNGSGKSSLLEALRFALTGEVDRVKLKKDFPLLVTEGATKARVTIMLDDGESVTGLLPTGKHLNPIEAGTPAALALNPARFMALKDDDRRSLLYDLSGNQGDVVKITRERLLQQKSPAELVDKVLPSLRVGFPEAHGQATNFASECRASWRGLTGEPYGVQKAEGWKPSTPVTKPTEDEEHEATEELAHAKRALTDAAERVGSMQATLDPEERRALQVQAEPLERFRANLAEGEAKLAELKERHATLTSTAEQTTGISFECPCCSAALRYSGGKVYERTADLEESMAASRELQDTSREIASTEQKLGIARARVNQAQAAADRLAAAGAVEDGEVAAELRQALADAEQRLSDAQERMSAIQTRKRHVEQLEQKERDAAEWHEKAKAWAAIAAVLAPDGLPNELLGWALKPVNDALRDGPEGWPLVQIRGDMTLTVSGRPYGLCSESEQWSADLLMAAWIAQRAGSGMVLVDRFDVLEPRMRIPFLEWMADRTEAGTHQFIVAGTFHSAPDINFARVYWMGSGSALEQAA